MVEQPPLTLTVAVSAGKGGGNCESASVNDQLVAVQAILDEDAASE